MHKPALLVTCRTGSEDWCVEEIGNVIFPLDPDVKVVKTKYSGLILVYSTLSSEQIYERARASEYGFVERIVPVDVHGPFELNFFREVSRLVLPSERVKLKLRIRGRRGYSGVVWKKLLEALAEKGASHDKSSNTCIHVEVIDSEVYMGRAYC